TRYPVIKNLMILIDSDDKNVYDISYIRSPSLNGEGTDAQSSITDGHDGDSTPEPNICRTYSISFFGVHLANEGGRSKVACGGFSCTPHLLAPLELGLSCERKRGTHGGLQLWPHRLW